MLNKWLAGLVLGLILSLSVADAQPGGNGPKRGRPATEVLFGAFDANDDAALTEAEVPPMVWARLKAADANGDGQVTVAEFEGYRPGGRGQRP